MYQERKDSFTIKDIVLQVLFIVLFVFILIWLFPMKGDLKKAVNDIKGAIAGIEVGGGNEALTAQIFGDNITKMKEAAKSYYTDERLPKQVGNKVSMTLSDMMDKHLLVKLIDGNNEACDLSESYVEITKLSKEYQMKVNLSCSDAKDYIIEHMGCYTYCKTAICEVKGASSSYVYRKSGTSTPTVTVKPTKPGNTTTVKPTKPGINIDYDQGQNNNQSGNNSGSQGGNNQGGQGGIIIGDGGTIDNSNSNNNITINYPKEDPKEDPKPTTKTKTYTDTYTSIPWVNAELNYKSTNFTLKTPKELDESNISNVRISNVEYAGQIYSTSEINNYLNNYSSVYANARNENSYSGSQWSSTYLARSISNANFSYSGKSVTWSSNYKCGNTTPVSGNASWGNWKQDTCMTGVKYRVTWKYDITE